MALRTLGSLAGAALVLGVAACQPAAEDEGGDSASVVELHTIPAMGGGGPVIGTRSGPPLYPPVEVRARNGPTPHTLGFGRAASAAEVARLDIDVGPDGDGLPPGSGTADVGAGIFVAKCAHCHGLEGEGGLNDRLVTPSEGNAGRTIGAYWPYATTIFDYTRRAMPFDQPGSLTDQEVYNLTAWLLYRNGIIGQDDVVDAESLPAIVMPGREMFVPDDREGSTSVR